MDAARGGLPDPCGGPQPVRARRAGRPGPQAHAHSAQTNWRFLEAVGGVAAVVCIALLAANYYVPIGCPSARRSARIEWEQRQAEIEAAIQEGPGAGAGGAESREAPATGGEQHEKGAV